MVGVLTGFLGLVLLVVTLFDIVKTTLVFTRRGGPITHRLSRTLWRLFHERALSHKRTARHLGPSILLSVVTTWLLLSWLAWTLIFTSTPGAVLYAQNMEPASVGARAYFAGFSVFTLGIGDYVPGNAFWRLLTVISSAQGFFVITLAITYIIPVVSSVTQRRQLASQLNSMGEDAQGILVGAWNGQTFGLFEHRLLSLAPQLVQLEQQHFSYPVLHFFVERERRISIEPAVVALDEALLLLEVAVSPDVGVDYAVLDDVRQAVAAYLDTLEDEHLKAAEEAPPVPALEPLKEAGMPLVTDYEAAITQYERRRRLLRALLEHSGWRYEQVVITK